MRNILIASIAFVSLSQAAAAQDLQFGWKLGLSVASVSNAPDVISQVADTGIAGNGARTGIAGGVFAIAPLIGRVSLQPSVLFVMKGARLSTPGATPVDLNLNYLEVPLTVRVDIGDRDDETKPVSGYVLAGPTFGGALSSSAVVVNGTPIDTENGKKSFSSLESGVMLGGGVQHGRFVTEVVYTINGGDAATPTYAHPNALRSRTLLVFVGGRF